MNAPERRREILSFLMEAQSPVSATALAKQFGVSRQIIVGDIALLRAGGADISATPRGYLVSRTTPALVRTVACLHTAEQMEAELNAIVDQGCTVVDVVVEHPIYGQLVGKLELSSRYDVSQFVRRSQTEDARPISSLTDGVHLHTIRCPDEAALRRVQEALRALGVLLEPEG
jgi:transcriptional regulator of NAD metabolism